MSIQTCFQLKDPDQQLTKKPIIVNICANNETINIDLNLFFSCSDFLTKNQTTDSDSIENQIEMFPQSYYEAVNKLKVKETNSQLFLKIISGHKTTFKSNSFFDIFKLSKYFCVRDLLLHLQKACDKIQDTNQIFSVLQKGQISKEEEEYFIKFLNCGHMRQKLSEKIKECFDTNFFTSHYPINATFRILKSCKSIDLIPAKQLYELIIQSFDENYRLLPFLDFYRLDDSQKETFCILFSDFVKKIDEKSQDNFNSTSNSSNYLLENKLKLNEMKMNDMKWKIKSLQIENEQLKKKIDSNEEKSTLNKNLDDSKDKLINKLKHENEQLKKKIDSNEEKSTLNKNSDDSKDKLISKLRRENDQLKKKVDSNEEKNTLNKNLDDSKDKLINKLKHENEQLKKKIDSNEEKNTLNKNSEDSKDNLINELRRENDRLKEKNKKIFSNLRDLSSSIDNLEKQIESLQMENKRLRKLKSEIQSFIDEKPNQSRSRFERRRQHDSSTSQYQNSDRIKTVNENKNTIGRGVNKTSKRGQVNRVKRDVDYSKESTKK